MKNIFVCSYPETWQVFISWRLVSMWNLKPYSWAFCTLCICECRVIMRVWRHIMSLLSFYKNNFDLRDLWSVLDHTCWNADLQKWMTLVKIVHSFFIISDKVFNFALFQRFELWFSIHLCVSFLVTTVYGQPIHLTNSMK